MSILSVPLTPELEKMIDELVKNGVVANKADAARKAIRFFAEEHAVKVVLEAEREVADGKVLRGELDSLADTL